MKQLKGKFSKLQVDHYSQGKRPIPDLDIKEKIGGHEITLPQGYSASQFKKDFLSKGGINPDSYIDASEFSTDQEKTLAKSA